MVEKLKDSKYIALKHGFGSLTSEICRNLQNKSEFNIVDEFVEGLKFHDNKVSVVNKG